MVLWDEPGWLVDVPDKNQLKQVQDSCYHILMICVDFLPHAETDGDMPKPSD